LSGARDDPARVRILPAGHRHAAQCDDVVASRHMVFVLSLGSFSRFVTFIGDGMVSFLLWQVSSKPI
jgi:hypothetical protein